MGDGHPASLEDLPWADSGSIACAGASLFVQNKKGSKERVAEREIPAKRSTVVDKDSPDVSMWRKCLVVRIKHYLEMRLTGRIGAQPDHCSSPKNPRTAD